ncbi:MAG: hypothetical protein JO057_07095 [Chloroflexi bacterium]|nr:hypothetical protein [Chloroflexota bacterium]
MYSNRGWSYSSAAQRTRRRRGLRLPSPAGWPHVSPLPFAVLLVGAVAWYQLMFAGFSVHGQVIDNTTGQPVTGAQVWSAHASSTDSTDGSFVLDRVRPPDAIGVDAPGYQAQTLRVINPFAPLLPRLDPVGVEVDAVDADTDQPIPAVLDALTAPVVSLGVGRVHIAPIRDGQTLNLSADGYVPAQTSFTGQDVLRVPMQPRLDGRVIDPSTGRGIADAQLNDDGTVLRTDADGNFQLPSRPSGPVQVLAPGYRRGELDLNQLAPYEVQLQPSEVRATYLNYFAVGNADYRQDLLNMLDTTEVNAVVIDIKGDYGLLSYHSNVPLADTIGANANPTIDDLDGLLSTLHQHGAYVIGRIVVYKDNVLARNGPKAGLDVGVKDRRTGQVWVDGENLAWVDPFQSAAWDYNTDLAREAIQRGFDEVQFDYIRFPTDPSPDSSVADIQYSKPSTEDSRVAALDSFLSQAHAAVNGAGGFLSMDTFGYTTWWDDDGGIGQDLQVLGNDIDYYCPMIYPSTFNAGLPRSTPYPDVVSLPYDVVYKSLAHAEPMLAGKHALLRPWLQYFDDYPWATKIRYDGPQIDAQKQAVADAHADGWMLWNAGSLFTRGGIDLKPGDLDIPAR